MRAPLARYPFTFASTPAITPMSNKLYKSKIRQICCKKSAGCEGALGCRKAAASFLGSCRFARIRLSQNPFLHSYAHTQFPPTAPSSQTIVHLHRHEARIGENGHAHVMNGR
jgi:hypothetical protein